MVIFKFCQLRAGFFFHFFHLALFNRGFLSAVIFTRKSKEEITKGGKKIDREPHQALLQIVVCSCQVLHWLSSSLPYVCVGVCFSPPYDRVLQCGVTRASGLCFFPFVRGKFFKSRTKNQHRCAFCPIDPLFPLPHQRLLDAVVLNPATLHLSLSRSQRCVSVPAASRSLPRRPSS